MRNKPLNLWSDEALVAFSMTILAKTSADGLAAKNAIPDMEEVGKALISQRAKLISAIKDENSNIFIGISPGFPPVLCSMKDIEAFYETYENVPFVHKLPFRFWPCNFTSYDEWFSFHSGVSMKLFEEQVAA
ncbi:MAG: hypothetical protein ABJH04_08265 [Cyclobacteriaceae bacterium]